MLKQNPEFVEDVLIKQVYNVEASLLTTFPNNNLKDHLETGSHYDGDDTIKAYLSFNPDSNSQNESIDLTFSIFCTQRGAIFSSEIAWSDGRTIDEVVVCKICPDCLEQLGEKVEVLASQNREQLIDRMVGLFDRFYVPA